MLYLSQSQNLPDTGTKARLQKKNVTHWIYLGEDSTWRIQAESVLSPAIERVSIADLLEETSLALRQPYIDWIGGLSGENASFAWWCSEIAAKNPYHHFFLRVCLLHSLKKLLAGGFDKTALITCPTPALYRAAAGIVTATGIPWQPFSDHGTGPDSQHLRDKALATARAVAERVPPLEPLGRISGLYQRFLDTDLRYRKNVLKRYNREKAPFFSGEKTVLFFTWVDRRSFAAGGGYSDPYFGPLPRLFRNRGYRVAFVPRVLFTIPFEEAVRRLLETKEEVVFPEQFITRDHLRSAKAQQAGFSPRIPASAVIGGLPVQDLALEHVSDTRALMPDNLLFAPMVQSMREQGVRPSQVIHTCEGHSWEQALSFAVHQYMPGTKVVGYDNVTFSRMVLSMYPSRTEFGRRPLPDRIVTNGPFYQKILAREGVPEELVRSGCALRHTYLWKENTMPVAGAAEGQRAGPVRILVATAIGFGDSVELIAKAAMAFGGDDRYELLIKCHPLVSVPQVREQLGSLIASRNIRFADAPVSALLKEVHVLLYTYTSVCYEALLHGVAPVCVRPENFLNLDKLDSAPDLRWCATTPDDLRAVVPEILNRRDDEIRAWREQSYAVVRDALSPPGDSCLDAFIVNQ